MLRRSIVGKGLSARPFDRLRVAGQRTSKIQLVMGRYEVSISCVLPIEKFTNGSFVPTHDIFNSPVILSCKISRNSEGGNDIYRMSASRLTPTRLRPSAPLSASRIEGQERVKKRASPSMRRKPERGSASVA
jgi:hypothetical protein